MGGNYKHSEVPDLPAADRMPRRVYTKILRHLNTMLYGCLYIVPDSVGEKEDFGDIDVLVLDKDMDKARAGVMRYAWQDHRGVSYTLRMSHPESQTSYICTFDIDGQKYNVQIDLISTKGGDLNFSEGYFGFNDLGNLIGRIAHRRGMKFGHDGLWYVHRRGSRLLKEILITDDFYEAIEYLGFNTLEYSAGFPTFERMFQWVESSVYFEPSAYPLEHQNHRARVRDSKRKTYNAFLAWLKGRGYDLSYVEVDKTPFIEKLFKDYPHVADEVENLEWLDDQRILYKEKVNGNVVSELTGVTGKPLGELMHYVHLVLPTNSKVLKYSESSIRAGIAFAFSLWEWNEEVDFRPHFMYDGEDQN